MLKQWNIVPSSTPLYTLQCSKCNKKTLYYCSEKFRMNSQKKNVDVWLIYKCQNCDSSFNIDIITRKNSAKIEREEFRKFQNNDKDHAWYYAFRKETITRNRVVATYAHIEYTIMGGGY